ncbi:MAG: phosphoribosylaminoimidazolesuccinocarboxamide synthase [Elusimicrobiota bacterium]
MTLERSEEIGLKLVARGKVRDIYALGGDRLLLIATDRISAFDHVLSPAIPGKGRILTQTSAFWFNKMRKVVPNHFISADLGDIRRSLPKTARLDSAEYAGRVTLAHRARRIDTECVVRGYLAGSAWSEYRKTGAVCGHRLPKGLRMGERLKLPIFTPATKADTGHDENISRERLADLVGSELAYELEVYSIRLYTEAAQYLDERGLILADTKFEFGFIDNRLSVIDEMLTPDSSRLWEKAKYRIGRSPASFDKQFVRDYLEKQAWNKQPPAPTLPPSVVAGTTQRYQEAYERLTQ